VVDLAHGKRRRRLVHDHELGLEGQGARDRDRLLLPARQLADLIADRRDPRPQPLDHALCLALVRGRSMVPSERPRKVRVGSRPRKMFEVTCGD
jgi:hypothetical protein